MFKGSYLSNPSFWVPPAVSFAGVYLTQDGVITVTTTRGWASRWCRFRGNEMTYVSMSCGYGLREILVEMCQIDILGWVRFDCEIPGGSKVGIWRRGHPFLDWNSKEYCYQRRCFDVVFKSFECDCCFHPLALHLSRTSVLPIEEGKKSNYIAAAYHSLDVDMSCTFHNFRGSLIKSFQTWWKAMTQIHRA